MSALSVITPEGPVVGFVDREVDEVTLPGVLGEFGVLDGHVAFISASRAGVLSFRKGTERGKVALGPGFVEVDGKGAVEVLVQQAVAGGEVDAAAAERLRADADGRLKKAQDPAEQRRAQADLDWAEAQLQSR